MQPTATEKWRRPFIGAQWLFLRSGPGATNHFEGGGFARSQRRRRVPEPDVPLPAAGDPLRRQRRAPRGTATRSTSGRCTPTRAAPSTLKSTDPREHPALRFNYLSTDQDRREWVEAIRVARRILEQPAMAAYNGGETSPGPAVDDRRGDPRLGRARRRDRAPPVVHGADGHRRRRRSSTR